MRNEIVSNSKRNFLREISIFLLFVLLATVLLGMMKLSQNYTYTLQGRIAFLHAPFNSRLYKDSTNNNNFQIKVEARGYELLSYILGGEKALSVDLSQYYYTTELDEITNSIPQHYYVYRTSSFATSLSEHLGKSFNILEIFPSSVRFVPTNIVSKIVPIVPNLQLSFDNQYIQVGMPRITPDSVEIYGEKNVLDTLLSITTLPFSNSSISKNFTVSLPLNIPDPIICSTEQIRLSVQVERYTSQTIKLPVEILFPPNNTKIIIDPGFVTLTYFVPLSQYYTVNPNDFQVVADFSDIETIGRYKIPLKVKMHPQNASHIALFPPIVDYYIQKL